MGNIKEKIVSFVFIAFAIIYIPSLFVWLFGDNISTGRINIGTIEESIISEGLFIRDEHIITSSADGYLIPEVLEGERVAKNSKIALVMKESDKKYYKILRELDEEIYELEKKKNEQNLFLHDIERIDEQVVSKLKTIASESRQNNFYESEELYLEIKSLLNKKASIVDSFDYADNYIESKREEKKRIEEKIRKNTKEVFSDYAGVVSYYVDGYENILTPESINEITPELINDIEKTDSLSLNSQEITERPLAKIIREYYYYIVMFINKKEALQLKKGQKLNVYIEFIDRKIPCQVSNVQKSKNNSKYLIELKLNECLSDTARIRREKISIILKEHEGFKVPISCLMDLDAEKMTAKIFISRYNYAKTLDVKIIALDEFSAIIEKTEDSERGIVLYDSYVLNPLNIKEGMVIK